MVVRCLPGELFPERRWIAATSRTWRARRAVVLSSHIGRDFERRAGWFDRLNRGLNEMAATGRVAVTGLGTTCHRFLMHASRQRDLPCVECELPAVGASYAQWTSSLADTNWALADHHRLIVSPPEQGGDRTDDLCRCARANCPFVSLRWPLADRLLATLGEELYVLLVRPGGNLEQVVTHHLRHPPAWPQRWMLAVGPDLVPPPLAERWLQQGAVLWTCPADEADRHSRATCPSPSPLVCTASQPPHAAAHQASSPVIPLASIPGDRYFSHWTRRQPGPWPDEGEPQYVQSLLVDPSARDRSAMASLMRIVRMRRLIATNALTRGETKVVCFTAQPLSSFAGRRIFRTMHGRWDFEPYGICIERNWLIAHGVRPVIYGDDSTWRQLALPDRPYFQHRGSGSGRHACDWTQEDEWRHVGDVDLSQISPSQLLVFVPDNAAAIQISAVCPWPVTIVGGRRG